MPTTKKTTKKTTKLDLDSVLDAAESQAPEKKGATPVIEPSDDLRKLADDWIEAKAEATKAAGQLAVIEQAIAEEARGDWLAECVTRQQALSSVKIPGNTGTILFTQSKRYRALDAQACEALREVFGDEAVGETLSVSVKEASAASEDALTAIIEALGVPMFRKHFEVKRGYKVTESFHARYCTELDTQDAAVPLILHGVVVPFKSTVKLS